METLVEHTFPIPETEAHKLDEIIDQLPSRAHAYIQKNALMMFALSSVAGFLVGLLWPRGKRH